jgi:DNA-binding NtrC family response regulator
VADDQAIPVPFGLSYREAKSAVVNAFERAYIEHALRAAEGNLSRAARECGKERSRLGRLLRKHKVRRADFQA